MVYVIVGRCRNHNLAEDVDNEHHHPEVTVDHSSDIQTTEVEVGWDKKVEKEYFTDEEQLEDHEQSDIRAATVLKSEADHTTSHDDKVEQ